MDLKEIQDILRLVNRTNLTEVEIEKEGFKIKIRRKQPENNVIYTTQAATSPAPQLISQPVAPPLATDVKAPAPKSESVKEEEDNDKYVTFKSPMIGTFYIASSPESPPFVKVGDQVQKGQVLGIIEAMKLFNEIESEFAGKVVKILVENAQPVEYDQPLYLIDPS